MTKELKKPIGKEIDEYFTSSEPKPLKEYFTDIEDIKDRNDKIYEAYSNQHKIAKELDLSQASI